MAEQNEMNEVVIFDGPESGMVYEFDGHKQLAIFSPDYKERVGIKNFKHAADLEEIQEAIKACEEAYLEEVDG